MRVLLTRATEDAARTRASLEALGHRVLISPVIAIEPTGAPWPTGVVDAVLATSGQAFAALPDGFGPSAEARRLLPLWLVGARTEASARAHGFLGAARVAPHAIALTFEMGKRGQLGRIVYLAGRDRKPDMETALSVREQTVEVVEVYAARPVERLEEHVVTALASGSIEAVLHFSRRSAEFFAGLAGRSGLKAMHVCLSEDVAAPLAERNWPITVAEQPNETAILAALTARRTAT